MVSFHGHLTIDNFQPTKFVIVGDLKVGLNRYQENTLKIAKLNINEISLSELNDQVIAIKQEVRKALRESSCLMRVIYYLGCSELNIKEATAERLSEISKDVLEKSKLGPGWHFTGRLYNSI